jgi:hypothetical protein
MKKLNFFYLVLLIFLFLNFFLVFIFIVFLDFHATILNELNKIFKCVVLNSLHLEYHKKLTKEKSKMVKLQNLENRKFIHSNIFGKVWSVDKELPHFQNWIIEPIDDEGKWFFLRNETTDLYLDSPVKASGKIYANLLYFKNPAQQWTFDGLRIINRATGLALGVGFENKASFTALNVSKPLENSKSQIWLHY